jgi:hypothetical protein
VMLLDMAISSAQRRGGPRLDVVVAGDFNRHDQLWGGDGVLPTRQGEARVATKQTNTKLDLAFVWLPRSGR